MQKPGFSEKPGFWSGDLCLPPPEGSRAERV